MGNTSQKNRHISGEDSGPSLTAGRFLTDPSFDSNDIYPPPYFKRNRASTTTSQGQVEYNPVPKQILPSVFKWEGGGKDVYMSGTFNDWKTKIPMTKSHGDFYTILELAEGEHQYKFLVDGNWVHDPNEPTQINTMGTLNNVIEVKHADFEVFEALALDSQITDNRKKHDFVVSTEYGQIIPSRRPNEKFSGPPILPPHLLQVILNKDTPAHCEPTLLPEPNHVMLNHLYALSIKDGVMVLSATHRFRKKFVTTLLYKPT